MYNKYVGNVFRKQKKGGCLKAQKINQYRVVYKSDKFDHAERVFIYADNHNEAIKKVMDTYDVWRNMIVSVSLWKANVDVVVNGNNIFTMEVL